MALLRTHRARGALLLPLLLLLLPSEARARVLSAHAGVSLASLEAAAASGCIDAAGTLAEHAREIGRAPFATADDDAHADALLLAAASPTVTRSHVLPSGAGGPDASALPRGGDAIHVTEAPLLTVAECEDVVSEAREAIRTGSTSTFTYTAANKLGEVHVNDLPVARDWLRHLLNNRLLALSASLFGIAAAELAVYDSLVIQYDAARGGVRQPTHRDAALLSINIALSPRTAYEGGGTYFEPLGEVFGVPQGHALLHASSVRHAGETITRGERWVLVVFLLARDAAQHARRCGERATELKRAGKLGEARRAYEAGLRAAPSDHQLHYGLASVLAMEGHDVAARCSLLAAAHAYRWCPKPHNALGSMMLAAGRTRGALRHFEAACARSHEANDDDGWDANVNAALCVITLAESAAQRSSPDPPSKWHGQLTRARSRLLRALEVAPGEPRLVDVLRRADALLSSSS